MITTDAKIFGSRIKKKKTIKRAGFQRTTSKAQGQSSSQKQNKMRRIFLELCECLKLPPLSSARDHEYIISMTYTYVYTHCTCAFVLMRHRWCSKEPPMPRAFKNWFFPNPKAPSMTLGFSTSVRNRAAAIWYKVQPAAAATCDTAVSRNRLQRSDLFVGRVLSGSENSVAIDCLPNQSEFKLLVFCLKPQSGQFEKSETRPFKAQSFCQHPQVSNHGQSQAQRHRTSTLCSQRFCTRQSSSQTSFATESLCIRLTIKLGNVFQLLHAKWLLFEREWFWLGLRHYSILSILYWWAERTENHRNAKVCTSSPCSAARKPMQHHAGENTADQARSSRDQWEPTASWTASAVSASAEIS